MIITAISSIFSLIEALFGVRVALDRNFLWLIIFQLFFSGLGEEIIDRSIPIIIFNKYIKGKDKSINIIGFKMDLSMILSSILFTIFHISYYSNQPLYAIIYSLSLVFFHGIIFSWIYRKTNSIWLCMIVHGLSNVIMFIFPLISGLVYGV